MPNQFTLQNDKCKVNIKEIKYDNLNDKEYCQVLNPADYENDELTKVFEFHVDLFEQQITFAIIGSHLADIENCALLDGQNLIVMMNEQFFKLNVVDGTIIDYKVLDVFGSHFALFKTKQGYVVHGEVEILFLNEEFELTASFSGRDIFVSVSGKPPFVLTEDTVQLYDFEDNYYEIDFNGKIIKERTAK